MADVAVVLAQDGAGPDAAVQALATFCRCGRTLVLVGFPTRATCHGCGRCYAVRRLSAWTPMLWIAEVDDAVE